MDVVGASGGERQPRVGKQRVQIDLALLVYQSNDRISCRLLSTFLRDEATHDTNSHLRARIDPYSLQSTQP